MAKALKVDPRDGKVQLKALGFGTVNGPTGNILHADDREAADKQARFPRVAPADAQRMIDQKLAEPYSGTVPGEDGDADMDVNQRAGEFVGHYADEDDSVDESTGLDTRQTTVFENPIETIAAAGGANRAIITAEDGTNSPAVEQAAPAGGGRMLGDARQDFTTPRGQDPALVGQGQPPAAQRAAAASGGANRSGDGGNRSSGGGRSRSGSRKASGGVPRARKPAAAPKPPANGSSSGSDAPAGSSGSDGASS